MSKIYDRLIASIKEKYFFDIISITGLMARSLRDNSPWFLFRKRPVTTSKSHEVMTNVKKIIKGGGNNRNLWCNYPK